MQTNRKIMAGCRRFHLVWVVGWGLLRFVLGYYHFLLKASQILPLERVTQETLDRLDHGHVFLRGKRERNA
jgi:hypothetical protein